MRKILVLVFCLTSTQLSFATFGKSIFKASFLAEGFADEIKGRMAEQGFQNLYEAIDYKGNPKPAYEVFRKGLIGYLNLSNKNKVSNQGIITLIDFSIASVKKRMWIIDLKSKALLFHDLVAHGKNSGGNYPNKFSNIINSNMSSLGFYVTANTYFGKHGLSLRLAGQDEGFNDRAMERAVVMHGADYVNKEIIKSLGRLGRSFGCPAVSKEIYKDVINTIADGTVLFIYYPDQSYLSNSTILKETSAIDYFIASNYSI